MNAKTLHRAILARKRLEDAASAALGAAKALADSAATREAAQTTRVEDACRRVLEEEELAAEDLLLAVDDVRREESALHGAREDLAAAEGVVNERAEEAMEARRRTKTLERAQERATREVVRAERRATQRLEDELASQRRERGR